MHHLILGTGPAGVIAAETIRKHAPNDRITLVSDEPQPPYSRMALPYLLIRRIDEDGTWLRKGGDHYRDQGIEVVRDRVTGIDAVEDFVQGFGGGCHDDSCVVTWACRGHGHGHEPRAWTWGAIKGVIVPEPGRDRTRPRGCVIEYCLFVNDRPKRFEDDPADTPAVARAHGRVFGGVKPANTLVVVAGLIGEYRVEIEAEAELDAD